MMHSEMIQNKLLTESFRHYCDCLDRTLNGDLTRSSFKCNILGNTLIHCLYTRVR